MTKYQYGVEYKGRDLGWVPCESFQDAKYDLFNADDKYLPGRIGRRELGPVDYNFDWTKA